MFRGLFHTGGSGRPGTWERRGSGGGWGGSSSSGGGSSSDSKGSGGGFAAVLIAIVLIFLAWFLSQVIRFSLSRSREYLADAGAVELTKNPDAMITALRKIEGRGELPDSPSAVMEMCVDNPRSGFVDLFATHPSIDRRIEALVRVAGGRDPGPIALAGYDEPEAIEDQSEGEETAGEPPAGGDKPFLPEHPPLTPGPWTPSPSGR
jgi:heat shock protein HtpX